MVAFVALCLAAILLPSYRGAAPKTLSEVKQVSLGKNQLWIQAQWRENNQLRAHIHALYLDPAAVQSELLLNPQKRSLKSFAKNDTIVFNAGFFTPEFRPTGLLVHQGKQLHPLVKNGGSGVFLLRGGKVELAETKKLSRKTYQKAHLAVQAGPRIIEKGGLPGIRSDDGLRANRTALGIDHRGRMVIVISYSAGDGKGEGPSLYEFQEILGSRGLGRISPELALDAALNLDGGPSTGIYLLNSAMPPLQLPERAPVQSIIRIRHR